MKVTFIFSGLPHYLVALLNKLVSAHGIELSVILPSKRGMSLGDGIKLGDEANNYLFGISYLDEIRGKFAKPYFRDLHHRLEELAPDILVIGWPFIINLSFDNKSRKVIEKMNISLVYREIPFMVAPKNKAIGYYRKHPIVNEDLEKENPAGLKFYPWAMALNQVRKKYYKLVDATMIYASHGKDIQESFGLKAEQIFLTYNSPDTDKIWQIREKLVEEGLPEVNPYRILHLGRLVRWKRVDLLIEAVSQLSARYENIELCIVGKGPEETMLKELAERRAPGRISFLGGIYEPEALGREIMASAVYVLAGMGGLSINEVMAYGLPVICSRCDGTEKDLVMDGENGLFFREGSATDLAAKIGMLLDDPETRRHMGEKSLSVIEKKINLETVAQRFMDCFNYLYKD